MAVRAPRLARVEPLEASIPSQAPLPSSLIRAATPPEVVMSKSADKPKKAEEEEEEEEEEEAIAQVGN
jgi:hypothetical protein